MLKHWLIITAKSSSSFGVTLGKLFCAALIVKLISRQRSYQVLLNGTTYDIKWFCVKCVSVVYSNYYYGYLSWCYFNISFAWRRCRITTSLIFYHNPNVYANSTSISEIPLVLRKKIVILNGVQTDEKCTVMSNQIFRLFNVQRNHLAK